MNNQPFVDIVFIINPLRKLPNQIRQFLSAMNKNIILENSQVWYTNYANHAFELALKACNEQYGLIVAIGGDGTFNEIVNGMITSKNAKTVLALIPNGTGNDFCRGQNIKFTIQKFTRALEKLSLRTIDIGMITNETHKKYFLNIADIGFGGCTVQLLKKQRDIGLKGGLSYALAIFRTFFNFKKPVVKIIVDDSHLYTGDLMMLAVCNGDTFGNGLVIHPGAKPDDGLLSLTLLGKVTLWDYVSNIFRLKKGLHIRHPNISYFTAKKIKLVVLNGEAFIETDGESAFDGDVEMTILPNKLTLLNY